VNPIFAAALEVQAFCRAQGWQFCFIGAIAVQRWGEPRLTQDVDLTILTGFGGEALLGRFKGQDCVVSALSVVNWFTVAAHGGFYSTGQFSTTLLFLIGYPLLRQSASDRNVFGS
jgi:hypothetical protein